MTDADLTNDDLDFLLSPRGRETLADATECSGTLLARLSWLRRRVTPEEAHAAVGQLELRERARAKFARSRQMYFTRAGLQQATSELLAAYKAQRFAGCSRVADLCCGIGGDAIGLAAVTSVVAYDHDLLATRLCHLNVAAHELADRLEVRCDDVTEARHAVFVHMDPMRRSAGKRHLSLEGHQPPFPAAVELCGAARGAALKTTPAVPYDSLDVDCEYEFLSERGECKQAVMWFGDLRRGVRRATVLPAGETIQWRPVEACPAGQPLRYVLEPDAAVIRAGLVQHLAARVGARMLDPQIAYLTSDRPAATALAKCYAVRDVMPWSLRRVKAYLHKRGIGRLTVKKRGLGVVPEEILKRLQPKGDEAATLILTRVEERPTALVAEPAARL